MIERCSLATVGIATTILGALCGVGLTAERADTSLALTPQPLRLELKEGTFVLNKDTAVLVEKDSIEAAKVGRQLVERINGSSGLGLVMSPANVSGGPRNAIPLTTSSANAALGPEGYQLTVTPDGVAITTPAGAGLFYGAQTLLQLLPPQVFGVGKAADTVKWVVPAVAIEDKPRFGWRGLMLDVSRHFFNKAEIKNFLDLMAQHKLNIFHWHLTDDQGWRIEIKRYPKLTEVGAWRTEIGWNLDPKSSTAYAPDGRYGGFFTQDDVREIVAYARTRYITVVPEIEMPGHAIAALASYPELSCTGRPYVTAVKGGEYSDIFCAGKDATFDFLQNVLSEVLGLFPSKHIHIGGDEAGKAQWKKCEKCQARIRQEGLKDENELQSYFIRRIEKFLNSHGRSLVGWDEILEGGLAPNATVMSWRGNEGGIAAANADHDVVMTPTTHCYFDYYQAKSGEPKAHSGFLPLEKVYSFEPVAPAIAADKAPHVLGGGGNLWTEFMPNFAKVQYMAYPRGCAMAEVTWSDPRQRSWDDFQKRLDGHLKRLKIQGVNYRPLRSVSPE